MSPRQARITWGLLAGFLGIGLTLTMADAQNGDPRAVERVQKVLANEKKKLGL